MAKPEIHPHFAATSGHPADSTALSCNFSGWVRDNNRIVQEYTYRGQGLDHRIAIELTVEHQQLPWFVLRFVHIWLVPANGYEGQAEIRLSDAVSSQGPGWLPTRIGTATGDATLLHVQTREGADAVWRLLSAGHDLEFAVRMNGEPLLNLPMPNKPGVQQHYEAILKELAPSRF